MVLVSVRTRGPSLAQNPTFISQFQGRDLVHHEWVVLAVLCQLFAIGQYRAGVILLRFDAERPVFVIHSQPGLCFWGNEATIWRVTLSHGMGARALSRPLSLIMSIMSDTSGSLEGSFSLRVLYLL